MQPPITIRILKAAIIIGPGVEMEDNECVMAQKSLFM
jgi:hypothetical protein